MASSIKINGDGTVTISFVYTAATDKVAVTLDAAAHMLYDRVPPTVDDVVIAWDDMTNAQKLALIEAELLRVIKHLASGYLFDVRASVMSEEAEADALAIM